jgi:hypothetical protein
MGGLTVNGVVLPDLVLHLSKAFQRSQEDIFSILNQKYNYSRQHPLRARGREELYFYGAWGGMEFNVGEGGDDEW